MKNTPKVIEITPEDVVVSEAAREPFVAADDDDEAEYVKQPQQTTSAGDAAKTLNQLASMLVGFYGRYATLHKLAKELNGRTDSDPLPDEVTVKNIVITYSVANSADIVAEISSVQRVGEIGELLRSEIERLVDNIMSNLTKIREISTASEQACNQAKFYTRMAQSKNVPS